MKAEPSLNRLAVAATNHCLTGCAIGEVLGLVIAVAAGWGNAAAIALAVALAFFFGYSLTMIPLLRAGLPFANATRLAVAADSVSIAVMEIVDNAIMLVIPGAMAAGLDDALFWGALALSLAIAWVVAFPVNRWLIARGRGHAVVHGRHRSHDAARRGPLGVDHRHHWAAGPAPRLSGDPPSAPAPGGCEPPRALLDLGPRKT